MERYHFIGIGGIGMSALARILRQQGAVVQGSEVAPSYVTQGLKQLGIEIFSSHHQNHLQNATTVIYGSDIKPHHLEYQTATDEKIPLKHRAELLAEIMHSYATLLVAGTHGKTTTSALLTHVLQHAGLDPSFALGGIALNSGSNGAVGKGKFFIAEADESDGTFLNYRGIGGIITNVEEEHLTFWKTRESLIQGFKQFAERISDYLVWCHDDLILQQMTLPGKSYGFSQGADIYITRWEQQGWKVIFDLTLEGISYKNLELPLLGKHNVLNAAAVVGLALQLGIKEEQIRHAFQSFKGVKRRMEKKGENRGAIIFDDYAHHPTEIQTTLQGLRHAAGERRVIAVFQPHRYSRLQDCWDRFLECFHAADMVFVTDIYAARESPIEGITIDRFFSELQKKITPPSIYVPRTQLSKQLAQFVRPHDVVITLGAGDVTDVGLELVSLEIRPYKMALLQGGRSAEHEVALLSSKIITEALQPHYYELHKWTLSKAGDWYLEGQKVTMPQVVAHLLSCDLVFPVLHGPFGEDGMIQGFLETLGIPYVGCDFRSCAITMDKAWTKHIAAAHGVQIAPFIEFSIHDWIKHPEQVRAKILQKFTYPFYIKAVHLGSTFGVHRITEQHQVDTAINSISKLDYRFLVEEEIKGRELEFGFIGDDEVLVSDAAEVIRSEEIHTYENKYTATGNPSIPKTALPAPILKEGRRLAEVVYRAVGCSALARIDFFLDSQGKWILNEVNPMPGFTPMSVYPVIWKAEGWTMSEVVDRIIIASLHRFRTHQKHLRPPEKPPVEL